MIKLFSISNLHQSELLNRSNRFIANIQYMNAKTQAHTHDLGRLNELLLVHANLLMVSETGKLPWYVKSVQSRTGEWILIDSALHNRISRCLFPLIKEFKDVKKIRSEIILESNRNDFLMDGIQLEVKGVSLVKQDGVVYFPDAQLSEGFDMWKR